MTQRIPKRIVCTRRGIRRNLLHLPIADVLKEDVNIRLFFFRPQSSHDLTRQLTSIYRVKIMINNQMFDQFMLRNDSRHIPDIPTFELVENLQTPYGLGRLKGDDRFAARRRRKPKQRGQENSQSP